jgi:prophage regulatory protein
METAQKFLPRREVEKLVGLKRTAIYDRIAAGRFPKPVHHSDTYVVWVEAEIIEWQKQRMAERDGKGSRAKRRARA